MPWLDLESDILEMFEEAQAPIRDAAHHSMLDKLEALRARWRRLSAAYYKRMSSERREARRAYIKAYKLTNADRIRAQDAARFAALSKAERAERQARRRARYAALPEEAKRAYRAQVAECKARRKAEATEMRRAARRAA